MKPSEVLTKARELLSDPAKWTKGALAVDDHGRPVGDDVGDPVAEDAVAFCSLGAMCCVSRVRDTFDVSDGAKRALRRAIDGGDRFIDEWNDDPDTTHADVLAAFDRAIELAKAEETGS